MVISCEHGLSASEVPKYLPNWVDMTHCGLSYNDESDITRLRYKQGFNVLIEDEPYLIQILLKCHVPCLHAYKGIMHRDIIAGETAIDLSGYATLYEWLCVSQDSPSNVISKG